MGRGLESEDMAILPLHVCVGEQGVDVARLSRLARPVMSDTTPESCAACLLYVNNKELLLDVDGRSLTPQSQVKSSAVRRRRGGEKE
jgi:hypothetical protein